MRAFVGILALLAATPAVAADQFDLVCKTKSFAGEAQILRFRIDLARGLYCENPCKDVERIKYASPLEVVFADWDGEPMLFRRAVDRRTGHYLFEVGGSKPSKSEGECNAAPYSGLPKMKF